MKKMIILLMCLFVVTGCSKVPELKYEGEKVVYTCTQEDIDLLKGDVNVLLSKNQGFVKIENGEWSETINPEEKVELEYKKNDNDELEACYFVNYDNMNYTFGTTSPISFKDETEGSIRFHIKGNYDYIVHNMEVYYDSILSTEDFDTTMETVYRLINTEIKATYIVNMKSKTFAEMQNEKEFTKEMIESINSKIKDKYGIEITKINIESVEKVS